jgi:hypothetical protein
MKEHPFQDDELSIVFEIACRSLFQDFVAISEDMDIADKPLSDIQAKLERFTRGETKEKV